MGFSDCEDTIAEFEEELVTERKIFELNPIKFGNISQLTLFFDDENGILMNS